MGTKTFQQILDYGNYGALAILVEVDVAQKSLIFTEGVVRPSKKKEDISMGRIQTSIRRQNRVDGRHRYLVTASISHFRKTAAIRHCHAPRVYNSTCHKLKLGIARSEQLPLVPRDFP
jgi:hypothetical protein